MEIWLAVLAAAAVLVLAGAKLMHCGHKRERDFHSGIARCSK